MSDYDISSENFETKQSDRSAFLIEMFLTHIVNPGNESHFCLVLKWFIEEGIVNEKDMAREFTVARTTVRRWYYGSSIPHPAMRKIVIEYLIKESNKYFKE